MPAVGQRHAADERDCIAYIAELWVEPGFRGTGVGTTLLRRLGAMIDLARRLIALKALPLREDHASTPTDAEVAGVKRFYTKNGFAQVAGEHMVKNARLCEAIKKRLAGRHPPITAGRSRSRRRRPGIVAHQRLW